MIRRRGVLRCGHRNGGGEHHAHIAQISRVDAGMRALPHASGSTRGRPAISVLVVTYNGTRHVAETIESVIAQTFGDWELIVLDDGSTDATLAIVRSFEDPRIIVLSEAHLGDWGHWRNVMARDHARGKYLAPLDQDDLWMPDKLARQHAVLESTDAVLAYTAWASMYENGRMVTMIYPLLDGDAPTDRLALLAHPVILHSAMLVRRSAFLDIGGYRGEPRLADTRLMHDLRKVGAFVGVNEPLTIWRRHAAQTSSDGERMAGLYADLLHTFSGDPTEHPEIRRVAARQADTMRARSLTADRGRAGFGRRVRAHPLDVRAWAWLIASYIPQPIMRWGRALYRRRPRPGMKLDGHATEDRSRPCG